MAHVSSSDTRSSRGEDGSGVVVIGAGLVGLACARALQKRGRDVSVLDPCPVGQGASWGNAGLIAGSGVVPQSYPGFWKALPALLSRKESPLWIRWRDALPTLKFLSGALRASQPERFEASAQAIASLSMPAFDSWMKLLDDCADGRALFRRDGTVHVYRSAEDFARAKAANDIRRRFGMHLEVLNAAAVSRVSNALTEDIYCGVMSKASGHVRSPSLLSSVLAGRIEAEGGRVLTARAEGLEKRNSRVKAVSTDVGRIKCDAVVVAAGVSSAALARKLDLRVPLQAERGYHLHFHAAEGITSAPILVPGDGYAVTPMPDGLRVAGLVEFAHPHAPPNTRCFEALRSRSVSLIPALAGQDFTTWVGNRPSVPDGLPIVGRAPRYSNAYLAFGHGHVGLTQAAPTAHMIAAMLDGDTPAIDPGPFSPDRYAISLRA